MEIERKFLIDRFPESLPLESECEMRQIYISVMPTVRARSKKVGDKETFRLTVKGSGELCREEIETSVTKEQFEALCRVAEKEPIRKLKRCYKLSDGLLLECSLVDEGTENEFMYAEVEFESVAAAEAFVPPDYLGKEVTYDNSWKMNNYWKRTRL
ncbi:MAG: hypothetical protein IJF23_06395 [Clostridia bacterium]|nr:hypothetical protein [Clostridia bacterium]